jgi:hypothetical protein
MAGKPARIRFRWLPFPSEREEPPEPAPMAAVRREDGRTVDLRATLGARTGPAPFDEDYGVTWTPWPPGPP